MVRKGSSCFIQTNISVIHKHSFLTASHVSFFYRTHTCLSKLELYINAKWLPTYLYCPTRNQRSSTSNDISTKFKNILFFHRFVLSYVNAKCTNQSQAYMCFLSPIPMQVASLHVSLKKSGSPACNRFAW